MKDIGHVIKKQNDPHIPEPIDLTSEEEKSKLKVRLQNIKVDYYITRTIVLEKTRRH